MTEKVTILAPHPDDELIGCHSLLTSGSVEEVIYFFDWSSSRKAEAENCAAAFGFKPTFVQLDFCMDIIQAVKSKYVLLPSRHDSHPHHKQVNALRRYISVDRLKFYSVDLQTADSKVRAFQSKQQALDTYYPSQASLWANDASYYLFESIVDSDIDEWNWVDVVLEKEIYKVGVVGSPANLKKLAEGCATAKAFINDIAAQFPKFEVYQVKNNLVPRSWK